MLDIIEIILLAGIGWLLYSQKGDGRGLSFFSKKRQLILDSCALIDGRIVEIVRAGFMGDELVIPQFILNELQLLADGNDSHKRERARYGLDVAHELQDSAPMRVSIDRTVFPNISATDDKLIQLAKQTHAQLYTTDYNLGKVAAVEGVKVLNVNELSQSLRPITLPGETLQIKVIQKGSNRDQGVGYLDDGTMIVIEGGARYVGREMPVTVTRMHQTVAGKMVFGQVREQRGGTEPRESRDHKEPRAEHREPREHREREPRAQHGRPAGSHMTATERAEAAVITAISEQPSMPMPPRSAPHKPVEKRIPAGTPAHPSAATSAKNKLHARLNMARRRRPTVGQ